MTPHDPPRPGGGGAAESFDRVSRRHRTAAAVAVVLCVVASIVHAQEPFGLTTPRALPTVSDYEARMSADHHAVIGLEGGVWLVIGPGHATLPPVGSDTDIFCNRSTDGGATWSGPRLVNHYGAFDWPLPGGALGPWGDYAPLHVATDGRRNVVVFYQNDYDFEADQHHGTYAVYVTWSTDAGASWAPARRWVAPDGLPRASALDVFTSVALDEGHLVVVAGGGAHVTTDGGATWGERVRIGGQPAPGDPTATYRWMRPVSILDRREHDGRISLLVRSKRTSGPTDAWGNDHDAFWTHSADGGRTWTGLEPLLGDMTGDGTRHEVPADRLLANDDGTWTLLMTIQDSEGAYKTARPFVLDLSPDLDALGAPRALFEAPPGGWEDWSAGATPIRVAQSTGGRRVILLRLRHYDAGGQLAEERPIMLFGTGATPLDKAARWVPMAYAAAEWGEPLPHTKELPLFGFSPEGQFVLATQVSGGGADVLRIVATDSWFVGGAPGGLLVR